MAMERHLRLPNDARVEITGTTLEELERAYDEFDEPEGKVEIINGRLIVSPSASKKHAYIVEDLSDLLVEVKRRNGWRVLTNLGMYCAATRDRTVPDLMVLPHDAPDYDGSHVIAHGTLMAAEIVSPGSIRTDREDKPRAYAQAGVPLFLLIDPEADKPGITLYSEPSGARYRTVTVAARGEPLHLPAPFDLSLDTEELLPG